jgi:trk system potassium uptake protein
MNFNVVFHLISFLLMVLAVFTGLVAGVSYAMGDPAKVWQGMIWSAIITLLVGFVMWISTRVKSELSRREGIGIVVFGWLLTATFGSLPFLLTGAMSNPFDAFFETCSGLTTTGASVLSDLEHHSRAILLWRATTHFFGGMGILVLVVAIIPYLGVGGMQIYQAEVTGPSKDRLTPRIASTAKLLWGVYILMNVVVMVLLKLGGMNWFDSVCHAFAAISTGGFSTRSAGIAAYDSVYVETVLIFAMFLSGINFALHYKSLRGEVLCYFKDPECRFYTGLCVLALTFVAVDLGLHSDYSWTESIRHSSFYVVSIVTCTGFTTVNYDAWPGFSKMILVMLFIIGGCAGSTSGGVKQMRLMVLIKKMTRDIRSFLKPQAIYTVKIGRQIVSPDIVFNIAVFFFIYMCIIAMATIAMSWHTEDPMTAFSSVITCISNVGPGFSTVGPVANFEHLDDTAKFILSIVMVMGRLEFYTFLVIFVPTFWRK